MKLTATLQAMREEVEAGRPAASHLRRGLKLRMVQRTAFDTYRVEMERMWAQPSVIEQKTVANACRALGWIVTRESSEVELIGAFRRRWVDIETK